MIYNTNIRINGDHHHNNTGHHHLHSSGFASQVVHAGDENPEEPRNKKVDPQPGSLVQFDPEENYDLEILEK